MDGKSLNITEDKLAQLKQLFPEVFAEDKIDFDKLKLILGENTIAKEERYELNWAGKYESFKEIQKQTTATLIPDHENSIDFDTSENIFIEGENLEALRVLQKSYYGKVKMIYIDPPYNTGNDSFVYPDDYTERRSEYEERTGIKDEEGFMNKQDLWKKNTKENGQFHSVWLSMMYPRLFLARNLLKEDGVIFVSIDDNEVDNLKLLMDSVFGEENFLNKFIWRNGRTSAAIYTKEHEYILAYGKNIESLSLIQYNGTDEIISDRAIKKIGVKNPASEIVFPKGIRFDCKDKVFPKEFGNSEIVTVTKGNLICKDRKLAEDVTLKAGWVMKDMILNWIEGHEVFDSKGQKVTDFFFKENGVLQYVKEKGTIHPKTIIEGFSTKSGTNEVSKLLGFKAFDYPKPIELINFLQLISEKDSYILDFFSGSASTAHAVLDLNKEDGGSRKFICVQMPELTPEQSEAKKAGYDTISQISQARIQKVIEKIKAKQEGELDSDKENPQDLGFKSFKLAPSNFKTWRSDAAGEDLAQQLAIFQSPYKEDTEQENMLYELLLKAGFSLTVPIQKENIAGTTLYLVDGGKMLLALEAINEKVIQYVLEAKPQRFVTLDKLFGKDDQLLTNTRLQLQEMGVDFQVI